MYVSYCNFYRLTFHLERFFQTHRCKSLSLEKLIYPESLVICTRAWCDKNGFRGKRFFRNSLQGCEIRVICDKKVISLRAFKQLKGRILTRTLVWKSKWVTYFWSELAAYKACNIKCRLIIVLGTRLLRNDVNNIIYSLFWTACVIFSLR